MNRLDFKHGIYAPDNNSTFEAYRNEDPFSFSFDVKIAIKGETLELFHLTYNQMLNKYREWTVTHKCKITALEQDNEK